MRRHLIAVPLLTGTLVLAACGGSDEAKESTGTSAAESPSTASTAGSDTADALPAEDLFDGSPKIVADPGGASATLQVSTKSKVACKVVYGKTEDVSDGSATDTDMANGPHTTHKAVMKGLTPDTTYYYRVEGSDTAGA